MNILNIFRRKSSLESELWEEEGGSRRSLLKDKDVLKKFFGLVFAGILLYYAVGMAWIHKIDDDLSFMPTPIVEAPASVVMAASLIEREVNENRWTANDPFFMPGAALDNMPNYQLGIMSAIGRFTLALRDHLGRSRGTSAEDKDLKDAAGSANYQGDKWYISSAGFSPASHSQYRAAAKSLKGYASRVSRGEAEFDARADNLLETLRLIQSDLGAASANIEQHMQQRSSWTPSLTSDDLYYRIKGSLYAYSLILQELERDGFELIKEKKAEKTWADMMDSLQEGATLHPTIILDGDPDGQILPSHLTAQGFYLLRARAKLSSMVDILAK